MNNKSVPFEYNALLSTFAKAQGQYEQGLLDDAATSNIRQELDEKIQEILKNKKKASTIETLFALHDMEETISGHSVGIYAGEEFSILTESASFIQIAVPVWVIDSFQSCSLNLPKHETQETGIRYGLFERRSHRLEAGR